MQQLMFILGELSDDDVDWIIETSKREAIPSGTVLIRKGESVDRLYLLLEGQLSVSIEGRPIATLNSGEIFGEMSFINSRRASATVETVKTVNQCVVLSISHLSLRQKLRQDVRFEANFYRALAMFLSERLRTADYQLGSEKGDVTAINSDVQEDADSNILESYNLAKIRYDWLLSRLRGDVENFAIDTSANF